MPKLFRKRFIPNETIHLKDDIIVKMDETHIITKWKALNPRLDFSHGCSCYFLNRGFKVSRFIDENEKVLYHYCDIIETRHDAAKDEFTFIDLLVDVVVYEDGAVKVLDLAEVPDALDEGLIEVELVKTALRRTDELLSLIYSGRFAEISSYLDIAMGG